LNALLDGEIEILQKREIEKHLENCVFCEAEYESLRAVGESLRQNLRVSAPFALDEKVLSAFQTFHREKRGEKAEKAEKAKMVWFGVPRFAFAAAFVLFALTSLAAFQIGRMSAGEVSILMPKVTDNQSLTVNQVTENSQAKDENSTSVKIVEVPVIREKIVKIPVYKETVVTRTIYRNAETRTEKNDGRKTFAAPVGGTNDSILSSRLKDNRYSTQVSLEGFQLVSELKPQIIKGENNEK
jgi:hypothetical protein